MVLTTGELSQFADLSGYQSSSRPVQTHLNASGGCHFWHGGELILLFKNLDQILPH